MSSRSDMHVKIALGAVALLALGSDQAMAATCYSYYYGYYNCNGLSTGARAGIGIAIAVGILALIGLMGYLRKRRTMRAFRQQQQQLPTAQSYNAGAAYPAANTYGANYQTPYTNQSSYYGNGQAGNGFAAGGYQPPQGPPPPKEAYRGGGGSAGEYLHNETNVNTVHEGAPPPSYVDVSQPNAQGQYAPPGGAPPSKAPRESGAVV